MFLWTLYSSTNPGKNVSLFPQNVKQHNCYIDNTFCGKSYWLRITTLQILLQFEGNSNALLSTEICYQHSKAYINVLI